MNRARDHLTMTDNNGGWPVMAGVGHNSGAVAEVAPTVKFEIVHKAQPETEEAEAFRLRRNAEIDIWIKAKETSTLAVSNERDLRAKVSATLFPTPVKGTQRYELGGGYKVKLVHGLTYTLGDKDLLDDDGVKVVIRKQIGDLEEAVAKLGDAHRILFEQLVTWEPKLSGSAFEKLDKDNPIHIAVRDMISEHLTIKPGSPTLEFETPKEAN